MGDIRSDRRNWLKAGIVSAGLAGASIASSGSLSKPAIAKGAQTWRMVTSWPKNSPGPGTTAERLAKRITEASDGKLTVEVKAAGEIVPAFEVFDTVSRGTAEMAHTAAIYWKGKAPPAAFFTTVPFGLTSREHMAWVYHGGGQELWDRIYEPFGVRPFMAGNTGMQMGGWFKRPLTSLDDLVGLKLRVVGFGGEIYRELGATPVSLPAGEIFPSLSSGFVDGAEFLGPWIDQAFGFYKVAKTYMWPGFNKPNGTGECLVNIERFNALSRHLQAVVRDACMAEHANSLAEADWHNATALDNLVERHGVTLAPFPDDIIKAAHDAADPILERAVKDAPLGMDVLESYNRAKDRAKRWSGVGTGAYTRARGL